MVQKQYEWADGATLEDHSRRKHKILREYFSDYIVVRCQLPQQERFRLAVIDGFAGGGRYRCGTAGSPIIFLVDSGTKRNGLSEADLDVFAKLFEQRLERGREAETLPGRQVVAEDDLLQLGVPQGVEVEIPRQVAPQPAVRVLHGPLLPRRVRVAEPGGHGAGAPEQAGAGEGGVVVERDGRAQPRVEPPEHRHHDRDRL